MDTKSKSFNEEAIKNKGNKGNKKTWGKMLYGLCAIICGAGILAGPIAFAIMIIAAEGAIYRRDHGKFVGLIERDMVLFQQSLVIFSIICLIFLVTLICLIVKVGKRDENGKVILKPVDRLFTELQLGIIALVCLPLMGIYTALACLSRLIFALEYRNIDLLKEVNEGGWSAWEFDNLPIWLADTRFIHLFMVLSGLIGVWLGLWMFLSLIRKIKGGIFLKQSILGIVFSVLYRKIKTIIDGGPTIIKVYAVLIAICLLSVSYYFMPFVLLAIIIFVPVVVKKYTEVKRGIRELRNGNLEYIIPVESKETGEMAMLARDINLISNATERAVQKEMKNQRLKADLISNVSHDIKTPLTSIVAYVDLMKKEGLTSENAPQYLKVLDEKTQRLKQLTDDLFEAAKASSGDLPVKMEKVEIIAIANQAVGEMSTRSTEAGLEFIIEGEKDQYFAKADGHLLWRCLENLMGNAVKYAYPGSRVYIDIFDADEGGNKGGDGRIVIKMKNVSRDRLNISADELMERFKRGDEARNTDGSGLGLAITRDLISLQNGQFSVEIDGDLFKATMNLESWKEG